MLNFNTNLYKNNIFRYFKKLLKVPAYIFLKEAIIRKYGEEFYEILDATAAHLKQG